MGTIIDKRPPPPKNFNTKKICPVYPVDITESFNDTTSCFTNGFITVIVNRSKCLNEQEYLNFHSHDNAKRSARITCSSCNSIRYINVDDYINNPFLFKCNLCGDNLIIVEFVEYSKVVPIIKLMIDNNQYEWFHYTCNHRVSLVNDTTSCEVFI